MKKLLILILSILILSTANFGYENIGVVPKEIAPNTNIVYVVYELNYSFPMSNFSLYLESDGIQFENTSINIKYIEENKKISGRIAGIIKNKSMDRYDISISKRYIIGDSVVSSIMYYHIYRSNESDNESLNEKPASELNDNTTNNTNNTNNNISNNTNNNTNIENTKQLNITATSKTNNIENDSSKEEVEAMSEESTDSIDNEADGSSNITNENKNKNSLGSYILYGLIGFIIGVLVAVIIVYLYEL